MGLALSVLRVVVDIISENSLVVNVVVNTVILLRGRLIMHRKRVSL